MFNLRNHMLGYRPLVGGIGVSNPIVQQYGTLGLICTRDGADRWILSNYHVLCRADFSAFEPGEVIHQPWGLAPDPGIARVVPEMADATLDVAAAALEPGVEARGEALGIGPISAPIEPTVGMRVIKSGIATGVTEGVVTAVAGHVVRIEVPSNFPRAYDLSSVGDSGSAWVEVRSRAPVALHVKSEEGGSEVGFGVRVLSALDRLGLRVVSQ